MPKRMSDFSASNSEISMESDFPQYIESPCVLVRNPAALCPVECVKAPVVVGEKAHLEEASSL